ncbi:sulfite exporter TauE/SafE [Clostridium puniceum]|uniref:Probable membrane transporter protein n=1 Tax=Clostridium puniceum TaxID=29367 RepID=A0A1S8TFW5_9CLOT|nr:sulfite exporter TauE/SafE family protein [Clostridium puniceum]OOM76697.1 sulfite exporter TauE/SafE [Clostridium puniceum]
MIILIYVIIILIATISGAISGLGGGVIIKPLFDMLGYHNAAAIGFYSSVAVFAMSIVSISKQLTNGFDFQLKTVLWISIGSLVGGIFGEDIFNRVTYSYENGVVKVIQGPLLVITLICILVYTLNKDKIKSYHLKNLLSVFFVGFLLGSISVFLGIGGGPLNVALLMLLFSYTIKEAAIYSIATIFFAQISKLGSVIVFNKLFEYDLSLIPFIWVSAIIGGFIGTIINQQLEERKIERFYLFLIVLLLFISGYNVI